MSNKEPARTRVPWSLAMIMGGMSGMVATILVHPLDLIKVRLQLLPRTCTTRKMAAQIIRCRGYSALYCGLSAGLLRQTTYTTTRVGMYHALYDIYQSPPLCQKLSIGVSAGLAGALAGCPSDMVLVRLMADGPLEACEARTSPKEYRGVLHAIYKICREEGVLALWRGSSLIMGRSVFVSVAQIGSYIKVRDIFRERKLAKGLSLHIYTSFISSFLTAVVSLPIDLVKTRYQVNKQGVKLTDIFKELRHKKGIIYFWKGFVPYYFRMAIHTIVALLVFDKLHQLHDARVNETNAKK